MDNVKNPAVAQNISKSRSRTTQLPTKEDTSGEMAKVDSFFTHLRDDSLSSINIFRKS